MIEIDVHLKSAKEAIKEIQREIVNNKDEKILLVIHGFNRGTTVKKLLENPKNIHNKRVKYTLNDFINPGRTYIFLK